MRDHINFLLAGVGGQGTILASEVLVHVGVAAAYQAKQAEVHGMSQRGGSVTTHVRWGPTVYAPLVGAGEVDVLLAFEKVEALRHLNQLRPGGLALINMEAIEPITVTAGGESYPSDEHLRTTVQQVAGIACFIDGAEIAERLGNARAANIVLLGALAGLINREALLSAPIPSETWLETIADRVPAKYVALNRRAFEAGLQSISNLR